MQSGKISLQNFMYIEHKDCDITQCSGCKHAKVNKQLDYILIPVWPSDYFMVVTLFQKTTFSSGKKLFHV